MKQTVGIFRSFIVVVALKRIVQHIIKKKVFFTFTPTLHMKFSVSLLLFSLKMTRQTNQYAIA